TTVLLGTNTTTVLLGTNTTIVLLGTNTTTVLLGALTLLLSAADGKVMVELKQTSDQFIPEHTEGVLQVNELNWTNYPPDDEDDEDEEWDLTVS
ncbi:RAD52 motif-containing protein 1, partial [Scomber scombrus]